MMHAFCSASVMTLIVMGVEMMTKQAFNWKKYIGIFLATFAFTYILDANACLEKPTFRYYYAELTQEDFDDIERKYDQHFYAMRQCASEVDNIYYLIPCTSDREKAEYCFHVLMASLVKGTPQSKVLAIAIAFCYDYVPSCINEWHKMIYWMEKQKYHFEMMEHYKAILQHYGRW